VTILVRYLLKELVVPLAAWVLFLFLLLFVMQFLKGTEVLLGSAVTARDLGSLTLFLAPHFIVVALPIAFLLSILLGLGRLNEDRELVAMGALGVTPWRIIAVPVGLGGVLGVVMLVLAFTAEPWGLASVKSLVNEVIKKNVVGDVKGGQFYDDLSNLTLYTEKVSQSQLSWTHVLLHDDRDPSAPLLVLAKEGRVVPTGVGDAVRLRLMEGDVHRAQRSLSDYSVIAFERADIVVGLEESIWRKNTFRSPKEELTPRELLLAAREAKAHGDDPLPFLMAFHLRIAQLFTPAAFALLGTPLAFSGKSSGKARGYFLTLLGYVAFYVLSRMFENMGAKGQLPLVLAAHLPNVVFASVGLYSVRRLLTGDAR
jgi:lipopolysaccharide export system permease protein